MKKIIMLCVAIIATTMLLAQDVIVTTDSKKIEAKIVEVSSQQVKYVDFNNQEGPTFVLGTDEISSIIFSNGQVKVYEHNTPKSIVVQSDVRNEYVLRQGNKYYYDGKMMKGDVYANFLKDNCTEAYHKYKQGQTKKIRSLNEQTQKQIHKNIGMPHASSITIITHLYPPDPRRRNLLHRRRWHPRTRRSRPESTYDLGKIKSGT